MRNMKLSKKALDELLVILKKDTGIDYSEEDAQEVGGILLRLTEISLRPHPKKAVGTG